jgi:hypothetical protein
VVLILISVAWLAIAMLGLSMVRAAAISDASRDAALVEWIRGSDPLWGRAEPVDRTPEQRRRDPAQDRYRATG